MNCDSETTVVNQLYKKGQVYIGRANGRRGRFGNPFTAKATKFSFTVKVGNDDEAVSFFSTWLTGEGDRGLFNDRFECQWWEFQSERRYELLASLRYLYGQSLGCFCVTPQRPDAPCHGFTLARLADMTHHVIQKRDANVPTEWTFEEAQALGWLSCCDIWKCEFGYSIKPWRETKAVSCNDLMVLIEPMLPGTSAIPF